MIHLRRSLVHGCLLALAAAAVYAGPAGAGPTDATLTVTVVGAGHVAIEPAGVICSSTCSPQLPLGTKVSLTATAAARSQLTGWTGHCADAGRSCVFELTGDATVGATFVRDPTDAFRVSPPPTHEGPAGVQGAPGPAGLQGAPAPAAPMRPPKRPTAEPAQAAHVSLQTEVDRALARLPVASVAFNTPSRMHLGETAEIQLLLSLRDSVRTVQTQLTELGERQGARVRVSPYMEARLTGLGFRIEAVTSEHQAISGSDATEWRWQIEPTTTGTRRLHLTLSALVHLRSGDRERTIRTFERTLEIRVTWMRRLTDFVGGNWQWLCATILVPAGAYTRRSVRKRRTTETRRPDGRLRARWKQRARPRRPHCRR